MTRPYHLVPTAAKQIESLVYTIEIRDAYTQGHSQRVADYAVFLAQWLGYDHAFQDELHIAGMLHDLGKIGIPDEILLKPGRLTNDEFELIKLHCSLSEKIIEKMDIFPEILPAVRHHHEQFNGHGYPDGLKGEQIPLMARILSIVDVFDALTTRRIYRGSMTMEKALSIMDSETAEGKFDPIVYDVFRSHIQEIGVLDPSHLNTFAYPELEERRTSFHFKNPITHLLNRDALLAFLRKGADREEGAFLAEINIRNFSDYNKTFGLHKGDDLLRSFASYLSKHLNATSDFEEPQCRHAYLFHGHADHFYFLELGFRSEFLIQQLSKLEHQAFSALSTDIYHRVILNGEIIPHNIEHKLGYLL